jgi:UDP-galactopyranose mutase
MAAEEDRVVFGGRLGDYRYYDMDVVVEQALRKASEVL